MDLDNPLDQIESGQAEKEVTANELMDALSPASLYGRRASTSNLLTWGYYGGRVDSTLIPHGTVTLTASQTNYIVASKTTGAVSVSTSNTNWNNGTGYTRLYLVVTDGTGPDPGNPWEDHRQVFGTALAGVVVPREIQVACSDESTALTTGTGKVTFRAPRAMTITGVRASLSTAQATSGGGGILTVDINEAGTTILSTKLTIDNTERTSVTAATPAVVSDTSIADDAEITIDIDQIGDGTAKGLKVTILYT